MQGMWAPVFGTTLGLSIAAAAAALVLPEQPVIDIAPMVQRMIRPPAIAAPVVAPVVPPPAAAPVVHAVVARPAPSPVPPPAPAPLPRVEGPSGGIDGLLRAPPAGWSTGTGFFVTSRGTLLTAAHVVQGCGKVRVMSAHMRPEAARVIAVDADNDVAVAEVPGLTSPAWLPVAATGRGSGRLAVLGFPDGALPDTPHETWAAPVNAAFGERAPVETDPARLMWFRSSEVAPGFSGGPVVDLGTGRVVGMVRGGIDAQRVPLLHGVATQGLALGPGAGPMLAMMSRWTMREGVVPAGLGVQSALEMTRRATVRVVCTK